MGSGRSSLYPSVPTTPPPHSAKRQFSFQNVFRRGPTHPEEDLPPSRSPILRSGFTARKTSHGAQTKGATEEERLGLVKGDTATGRQPTMPEFDEEEDIEDEDDDDDWGIEDKPRYAQIPNGYRRELTPPRRGSTEKEGEEETRSPEEHYEQQRRKWEARRGPPPPFDDGKGNSGAFI
jgi:hypothetical protein